MRKNRIRANGRGWSLLELLVSVSILVLLLGAGLPLFDGVDHAAKEIATAKRMEAIDRAVRAYLADVGGLPPDLDSLRSSSANGWTGPYLDEGFVQGVAAADPGVDAWGRAFEYTPLAGPSARLRSGGRDGVFGGEDDVVKTIRGEDLFRRETVERIETAETAIFAFVRQYRPGSDFPSTTDLDLAYATLAARGFLGADPRYRTDAWGNPLVPDPPAEAGRPICRVRSPRF